MDGDTTPLSTLDASLRRTRAALGEYGTTTLDSGLVYGGHGPVEVHVRKRVHRYHISDGAAAVSAAGRPAGWLEVAERVVEEADLNVNRRGVVFVPVVEGRDIAALALRVAEASLAVYAALLESREPARARR